MNKFKEFLKEVAPYVVIVGSYSRNQETSFSDIDFYVRRRPGEDIDNDMNEYGNAEESYIEVIIKIVEKYGYEYSSVIMGHIALDIQNGVPIMLEFSWHYKIPVTSEIFEREILGVKFLCGVDNKDAEEEELYEYIDFDDVSGNLVIKYPLPSYKSS